MTRVALIAGAAMLTASFGVATAQTSSSSTSSTSPSAAGTRCWDAATNMVKQQSNTSSKTGTSTNPESGGASYGSSASNAGSTPSTIPGKGSSDSRTRPPEAASLPDCR